MPESQAQERVVAGIYPVAAGKKGEMIRRIVKESSNGFNSIENKVSYRNLRVKVDSVFEESLFRLLVCFMDELVVGQATDLCGGKRELH